MKLCKNCNNFRYSNRCFRPKGGISLVDGSPPKHYNYADVERTKSWFGFDRCGPEAKYWEPVEYYIGPVT